MVCEVDPIVSALKQALYYPSIHLTYIAMRDADTTYEASSKAKEVYIPSESHIAEITPHFLCPVFASRAASSKQRGCEGVMTPLVHVLSVK
eukprot:superscaffoldBa00000049_g844